VGPKERFYLLQVSFLQVVHKLSDSGVGRFE
jgi:hypothetical protein